MTKYCRRVIVFLCDKSSALAPLFVRGIQFLHTLCRGGRLAGVGRDGLATKADLDADFRDDPCRAPWIRAGAIAGTIVAAAGFAVAVELL